MGIIRDHRWFADRVHHMTEAVDSFLSDYRATDEIGMRVELGDIIADARALARALEELLGEELLRRPTP